MQNHHNWVFIRGLAREGEHWGQFRQNFATKISQQDVVCLDLPGTGKFNQINSPTTISEITNFVVGNLKKSHPHFLSDGFSIAAVSMGGMVAVEWAIHHPKGVQGLVIANSSFQGLSKFYQRLKPTIYPHLLNIIRTKNIEDREAKILKMVSNDEVKQKEALPRWLEIQRLRPMALINFFKQIFAASFYKFPKNEIPKIPVLLLASESDRMVNPVCSKNIAQRWGCEIRYHPTAGHDIVLDAGDWVITQIAEWLKPKKP